MARKQIGTDYLVFANTGTSGAKVWKALMCQTTVTGNFPTSIIDASSKCGKDSMVEPDIESYDLEGQLLQKDATDTNRLTAYEIHDMRKDAITNGVPIEFKLAPKGAAAADNGKIIYEFDAYISNISDTFDNGEVATQSLSLQVVGETTFTEYVHTT